MAGFSFPSLVSGLSKVAAGRAKGKMAGEDDKRAAMGQMMQQAMARAQLGEAGVTVGPGGEYWQDETQSRAYKERERAQEGNRKSWLELQRRGEDPGTYSPNVDYSAIISAVAQRDITNRQDEGRLREEFDAGVAAGLYQPEDWDVFRTSKGQTAPSRVRAAEGRAAEDRAAAQRLQKMREDAAKQERQAMAAKQAEDLAFQWVDEMKARGQGHLVTRDAVAAMLRGSFPDLSPIEMRNIIDLLPPEDVPRSGGGDGAGAGAGAGTGEREEGVSGILSREDERRRTQGLQPVDDRAHQPIGDYFTVGGVPISATRAQERAQRVQAGVARPPVLDSPPQPGASPPDPLDDLLRRIRERQARENNPMQRGAEALKTY